MFSDHIQLAVATNRGLGTTGTQSMHFQSVAGHAKAMLGRDFFEECGDVFVSKFDELAALFADEVIVLGVAVVVFVDFAVVGAGDFANESGIFKFADGAINGCAADTTPVTAGLCQTGNDAVAVKVFMIGEDFADDGFAFLSEPFAARSQKFTEFLQRRDRDLVRSESGGGCVCHRRPSVLRMKRLWMRAGESVSAAFCLDLLEHTVEGFFEDLVVIIVSGFDGTTNGGEFFLTSPFCVGFGNGAVRGSGLTACGVHAGYFRVLATGGDGRFNRNILRCKPQRFHRFPCVDVEKAHQSMGVTVRSESSSLLRVRRRQVRKTSVVGAFFFKWRIQMLWNFRSCAFRLLLELGTCALWLSATPLTAQETPAAAAVLSRGEREGTWNGFRRLDFELGGRPVLMIIPQNPAEGRPWVWHGEFFGHRPIPDVALLGRGFHVVYTRFNDQFGGPAAVQHWNAVYQAVTDRYGLGPQPALVGTSRGGLYCYNWAAANPDRVSCIFGDAPVCDLKSWPMGRGSGRRSDGDVAKLLAVYGVATEDELLQRANNPIDLLQPLAKAGVPILHVSGDADEIVPLPENTGFVQERYRQLGGSMQVIIKPGVGHVHGLDDSTPIIEFIDEHGRADSPQTESSSTQEAKP